MGMNCYRCGKALSPGDQTCSACGQPVYDGTGAAARAGGVGMSRRLDGALRGVPSGKDYLATPTLSFLPHRVDLRDNLGAVEDQGQVGSCVANAVVGAIEHQHRKAGRVAVELSRMFVYFNGRQMRGTADRDSGMTTAEGLAAALAFGAPPEPSWPYDPKLLSKRPDDAVYAAARDNAPAEYARVTGTENVKRALAQGHPVVFLVSLPERCYAEAGRTGVMPSPTASEVTASWNAGHSMLLAGYDLDAGQFLVRNSWGPGWGDKGYFRMPFDAFDLAAEPTSHWVVGRLEAAGAFTIDRPKLVEKPVDGGVRGRGDALRHDIRGGLGKSMDSSLQSIKDRFNPKRG